MAEKPGLSDRFPGVSRGVLFKQTLHNMYIMIYNLVILLSFTYLFIEKPWLAFNEPSSTGLQVLGHSPPHPTPAPNLLLCSSTKESVLHSDRPFWELSLPPELCSRQGTAHQ